MKEKVQGGHTLSLSLTHTHFIGGKWGYQKLFDSLDQREKVEWSDTMKIQLNLCLLICSFELRINVNQGQGKKVGNVILHVNQRLWS